MKYKKAKALLIVILIISIFIYLYNVNCYRTLPETSDYKIISNTGARIPAKLYLRTKRMKKEIIICFDDTLVSNELNISGDEKLDKYLVIASDLKIIGLVDHTTSFIVKDKCICQTEEEADYFTSMINNYSFYKNPPIKEATFSDKKIVFNTYGILKKYGDSIIVEKRG